MNHDMDDGMDPQVRRLYGTTDAAVWTDEFLRNFPNGTADWGTLVGWFANAIEVGREAGRSTAA